MGVFSPTEFYVNSELQKFIAGYESLKPGDVLKAHVIEIKKNGRALIDLGHFRAVAYIHFPINPGEYLSLMVTEKEPQLKLQVLAPGASSPELHTVFNPVELIPENAQHRFQAAISPVISYFASSPASSLPASIHDALHAIAGYFEPIDPFSGDLIGVSSQLQHLIQFSGLFMETELANILAHLPPSEISGALRHLLAQDLRYNLRLIRDFLLLPEHTSHIQPGAPWENLLHLVDELLLNIRRQLEKAVNRLQNADNSLPSTESPSNYLTFHFPLPLTDNPEKARLKIYYHHKSPSGQIPATYAFRLSMLLHLIPLGDLRADFYLRENDLSITFFVVDADSKSFLDFSLSQLEKNLKPLFRHILVSVVVSEKKIYGFETEDLDSDIMSSRMIDVKV